MKHFDQAKAYDAKDEAQVRLAAPLRDAGSRALIQQTMDELPTGVVFWDARGRCELANRRTATLLGIDGRRPRRGDRFADLLKRAVEAGALSAESGAKIEAAFKEGAELDFDCVAPSGRAVMARIRPRSDNGRVLTLTEITDFRLREEKLTAEKARAEKMERRLGAELARLNAEKAEVEARQEELQRLSLVAAHAKDLIVITDPTNRIVWANEAFRRHNGLDLEMDLLGRSGRDVLAGPQSEPEKLAMIDEAVRNRQSVTLELICHRRSGAPYWMEQEIIPVFDNKGAHTNFIIVGRDVSERKRAEAAAAEARRFEDMKRREARMLAEFNEWLQSSDTLEELFVVVSSFLAKLLPGSSGAVYTYGAARDTLQRACAWGEGAKVDDLEPSDCWALRRGRAYFHGDNTIDIACAHVMAARGGDPPERQYCLPIIAHGDTVGLLSVELDAGAGQDTQKLVNFCAEHISVAIANVKMRDLLREQSTRDPLTGLYNRRFFLDYAKRELGRCVAQRRPAALISLDVDHFKTFNDNYGHDAGDAVLRALATVLQKLFREADVPCRLGGEEFVVMMPGCGAERAIERAEQLRKAVEAMRLRHSGESLKVTISLGLAALTDGAETLQDLMLAADEALYKAKAEGRNRVRTGR
ncbi:diguanylate cyclase [Pikeienuella piscinae]|uniref:diguanylate cyclase n=1 Tax=Pikeienuella piscinae TaxID=2748098 RepID=A0A7L5C1K5_9RHOB|nr:diguanylate cyclase [Pikeienuella piscinae]QIE56366.1 diguanylate cyclase [Pikeienuella piscinae]